MMISDSWSSLHSWLPPSLPDSLLETKYPTRYEEQFVREVDQHQWEQRQYAGEATNCSTRRYMLYILYIVVVVVIIYHLLNLTTEQWLE